MKKALVLFITLVILFTATAISNGETNPTMTVKEAQDLAVENSQQQKIDQMDITIKETLLTESKDLNSYGYSNAIPDIINRQVNPIVAATNLEVAKKTKDLNTQKLRTSVYKQCYNIILTTNKLDVENKKLAILKQERDLLKKKFDKGLITQNDLNDMDYNIDSKTLDITQLSEDLKSLYIEFNNLLNLPIDQNLVNITGEITYDIEKNNDLDKLVIDALNKDLTVFQRVEDLKAKDKAFEMNAKYYIKGDSEYDQAEFDVQNANVKIIEAKANLEVNIRNKYNDLLSAQDSVTLADKYLALAGKKLDISNTKLKNGMIDPLSNLNEKLNYTDAQYKRLSAVASYNTLKVDFEDMIQ